MKEQIVTTQQTSKRFKVARAIYALLALIGGLALWGGTANERPGIALLGFLLLLIAAGFWLYAKVGRWWHNE